MPILSAQGLQSQPLLARRSRGAGQRLWHIVSGFMNYNTTGSGQNGQRTNTGPCLIGGLPPTALRVGAAAG